MPPAASGDDAITVAKRRPSQRFAAERWCDVALAVGIGGWAAARFVREPSAVGGAVALTMFAFQLVAAGLLLFRRPARVHGSAAAVALSAPSILLSGVALKLAGPPERWPKPAVALFVAGGAWAVVALLCLGRSFAFFPAVRDVVARGPYRWVRHPAYAGELVMAFACAAALPGVRTSWPAVVLVPLLAVRILAEERTLRADPGYWGYADRVRWRLVPGVW